MLIIFILVATTLQLNTTLFVDTSGIKEVKVLLNAEQQIYYQQFDDYGKILSVNFTGNDISKTFCQPFYQGVSLTISPEGLVPLVTQQVKKSLDDLSEEDLFVGYREKLISIANSPDGICVLTSKGNVYLIQSNGNNPINIKNQTLPYITLNQESGTLIYDEKSRYFFAFFKDHLIKFQFQQEQLDASLISEWISPQKKMRLVASNGWLYCAQEEDGLLIYQISHNHVKHVKTIKSIDLYNKTLENLQIVDIAVFEDKLYILDAKNGVSLFNIYFNGTFTKNDKFGTINLQDCHSISAKDTTLIVLQNFKSSYQVVEFYVKNDEWIQIRKYVTKSKLQRADIIDDNLVIIRGLHDHKILLTRMPDKYLDKQNHQLENYFFSGNLLGVETSGDSNDTLIAVSPHGFYKFSYYYYPTYMICNSNNAKSGRYQSNMILKSTNCSKKIETQEDLLYCWTDFHYTFEVRRPLFSAEEQQNYTIFVIILGVVCVVMLSMIGYCYSKQQKRLKQLMEIEKRNKANKAQQLK
ncbi:unnamed protein product (macronuclear) [Paramecium tetraurelia]|uniref:Transmembrane protein n=1 Tax=Paramecium tetraurelia TaxID=5888 RepID=A0C354_PARTE|nr:uncharacterized protein GSPATT00034699001 [Paramecium tetraurelia]CAK65221.1 unnamed protein product [Paramecium tetraurelia]|eukprot:XP_001432618.1 hypothetical protein (macronuclear) [Paramecium tetraurelia strain d4-2]